MNHPYPAFEEGDGDIRDASTDQTPGQETDSENHPRTLDIEADVQESNVHIPEDPLNTKHHSGPMKSSELIYGVEHVPSWYMCLLLGMQHFFISVPSVIGLSLIVAGPLCILEDDPARGYLVTCNVFVSGFVTLLQSTFGVRLPIVQGATATVLLPIMSVLDHPDYECPAEDELRNMTEIQRTEEWQTRIRVVQGAVMVASLVEVLLGLTGAIGLLMRWITPLAITPVITMVGLSFSKIVARKASGQWGIAVLCTFLMMLMSQYLRSLDLPLPRYTKSKGWHCSRFPFFTIFPILTSVVITWLICGILTVTDVLSEDSEGRTDKKLSVLENTQWFYIPYPGQWGKPTVSIGAVIGVMAGILATAIESVGDYTACAKLSDVPPPPNHAINRGILIEGLGTFIGGWFGTGNGTTSYTGNIAAIRITKAASRRMIQTTGILLLVFGIFGKFGALFVTMPDPIIGGMLLPIFGMIASIGLSNLQYVDLNSSRNLFIVGFSIFVPMICSDFIYQDKEAIETGSDVVDQVLTILLKTPMFVGGLAGIILDNTIPGTPEERGLTDWRTQTEEDINESEVSLYDLPGTNVLTRWKWCSYLPFSPTWKRISL